MAAEKWDETVCHEEEKINRIIDMLEIRKGSTILDVGTGTGVMIPFLHKRAGESGKIIAVDLAENMIKIAKSKYNFDNVEFIVKDILSEGKLPINQFDYIICYSMFPHFQDKRAAIAVLSKYLNKNGKIIICHTQSRDDINKLHSNLNTATIKGSELPPIDVLSEYFKENDLKTLVKINNVQMFVIIGLSNALY